MILPLKCAAMLEQVMIGSGLDDVPRSQFDYDFSFEKKITAELQTQPPEPSGTSQVSAVKLCRCLCNANEAVALTNLCVEGQR